MTCAFFLVQVLSFSCSFWQNICKLIGWRTPVVGAPPSGKFWIRLQTSSQLFTVIVIVIVIVICQDQKCRYSPILYMMCNMARTAGCSCISGISNVVLALLLMFSSILKMKEEKLPP